VSAADKTMSRSRSNHIFSVKRVLGIINQDYRISIFRDFAVCQNFALLLSYFLLSKRSVPRSFSVSLPLILSASFHSIRLLHLGRVTRFFGDWPRATLHTAEGGLSLCG